jgi:hypothetical protein
MPLVGGNQSRPVYVASARTANMFQAPEREMQTHSWATTPRLTGSTQNMRSRSSLSESSAAKQLGQ